MSLHDRDVLFVGIHYEQGVRQTRHIFDTCQVLLQLLALALEFQHFFLRQQLVAAVTLHFIELFHALNRFLNRRVVRQEAAQPAMVDVEHSATSGFFGDGLLSLPLGAHKEKRSALLREVRHELGRVFEELQRLLKIDDVDSVALPVDVLLHLRIPAPGLMAEVYSGLQKFFHGDARQNSSVPRCQVLGVRC